MPVSAYAVSPQLLRALRVEPALGRAFGADDYHGGAERPALLMHRFWRAVGGDRDVIGKSWRLEDRTLRVVGVMPADFILPTDQGNPQPDVLIPLVDDPTVPLMYRIRTVPPIGRLKDGVTIAQAQAEAQAIARGAALQTGGPADVQPRVRSLRDAMFGNTQPVMLVLLGAAGFILLIVCANLASLLLARGSERERELAVRAALGASRRRLIRQLVIESLVLASAGGAAGLLIAYWTFDFVYTQVPERVYRMFPAGIDLRVMAFAAGLSILAGLLFGALPAARMSKPDVNESLQGGKGGGIARLSWRTGRLMVIGEVALVVMLLAGAGLMVKSFARLRGVDLGLNPDQVYTLLVDLPRSRYPRAAIYQFDHQLLERLSNVPGIDTAAGASGLPLIHAGWAPLTLPNNPDRTNGFVWLVTGDYFKTFSIRLLAGRPFTEREARSNAAVAVLSESAARAGWPSGDALGKMIQNGRDQPRQIVGVVSDVRRTRRSSAEPVMYTPFDAATFRPMSIAMRIRGERRATESMVMAQVHSLDPTVVARLTPYADTLDSQIALPRFQTLIFSVFGTLGLALAAIGIFGVVGYVVSRRTHEIGVRMALGADARDVRTMVIRQALTPVVAGLGLGLVGAFWVTRFLTSWLFEVTPHDPLTLTLVSCLLLATALGATYLPARRASQVDPMEALRSE